jgi:hypothetical protein
VYECDRAIAPNYLYPMYRYKQDGKSFVSTSVFELIKHKGVFHRNPKFQTTTFWRPTFATIDRKISRVRTIPRRSTLEIRDADTISTLGAAHIQDYISSIELAYPDHTHVLLMGGKDSQNILLAKRSAPWVVVSGEPNTTNSLRFCEKNGLKVDELLGHPDHSVDDLVFEEVVASDCFYDPAHFRYLHLLLDIKERCNGKLVVWMGTSGDGIFAKNANHRDEDYFAVHELHVGMSMGIYHQVIKNILNCPVLSPYQSPSFLDELFFKFDPFFVKTAGDIRSTVGEKLHGSTVWYPETNPSPSLWARDRNFSIAMYYNALASEGLPIKSNRFMNYFYKIFERIKIGFRTVVSKRRGHPFVFIFYLNRWMEQRFGYQLNTRHNVIKNEIK